MCQLKEVLPKGCLGVVLSLGVELFGLSPFCLPPVTTVLLQLQAAVQLIYWIQFIIIIIALSRGFPGSSVVKNPPANAGDLRSVPGSG